jgi:hypothetical protein
LSLPSTRYELEGFEEQQMESVYVYTSSSWLRAEVKSATFTFNEWQ